MNRNARAAMQSCIKRFNRRLERFLKRNPSAGPAKRLDFAMKAAESVFTKNGIKIPDFIMQGLTLGWNELIKAEQEQSKEQENG